MDKLATKIKLVCQHCGVNYFVVPSRKNKSKFCSRDCQLRGQPWTEERKRKIGLATSGPRLAIRGEKNYNWGGGSWNYIKTIVRIRDNDTCQCAGVCKWHLGQKCGFRDSYIMHVDHIKPKKLFPELTLAESNLITVCPNCHQLKTNLERRSRVFNLKRKK